MPKGTASWVDSAQLKKMFLQDFTDGIAKITSVAKINFYINRMKGFRV